MHKSQGKDRTYSMEFGKITVEVPLDTTTCLLCTNEAKTVGIGECGHRVICYLCLLRLRWVMNKTGCPICKSPLNTLYITSDPSANYKDFPREGHSLIKDERDPDVFFEDRKAYDQLVRLRGYFCPFADCGKQLYDQKGLEGHLRSQHNRVICQLCFKNRPVFVGEQFVYPSHKLLEHMKYGEYRDDVMIKPHPFCPFCDRSFYTEEPLLNHLSKVHMNCHLCGDKHKYVYYKDYKDLETHFQKSHYLCLNEICRNKCFVVFGTLEELYVHNYKEHSGAAPSKGIIMDARKVGLFSPDEGGDKKGVGDLIGTDFSGYFAPDYAVKMQEALREKQRGKEQTRDYDRGRGRRYHGNRGRTHYGRRDEHEDIKETHKEAKEKKGEEPRSKAGREDCIVQLHDELRDLIKKKLSVTKVEKNTCTVDKEQLYQLSSLIDAMSLESMVQCEFLMNFGISLSLKKHLHYLLQSYDGHIADEGEFFALSIRELLIIYKYFDIAVQKINKKFIKQDLSDINEDLLADFKAKPEKAKQAKKPIDIRDALRPTFNLEDKNAFPELESKPKQTHTPATVWERESKTLDKKMPKEKLKDKKGFDEEFPSLPEKPPNVIKEEKKEARKEVKKTLEEEYWPDIGEESDKGTHSKGKGKKHRERKKKQVKGQPQIEIGFY